MALTNLTSQPRLSPKRTPSRVVRAEGSQASSAAQRAARLEELRALVASGRYKVPSQWLAHAILKRAALAG